MEWRYAMDYIEARVSNPKKVSCIYIIQPHWALQTNRPGLVKIGESSSARGRFGGQYCRDWPETSGGFTVLALLVVAYTKTKEREHTMKKETLIGYGFTQPASLGFTPRANDEWREHLGTRNMYEDISRLMTNIRRQIDGNLFLFEPGKPALTLGREPVVDFRQLRPVVPRVLTRTRAATQPYQIGEIELAARGQGSSHYTHAEGGRMLRARNPKALAASHKPTGFYDERGERRQQLMEVRPKPSPVLIRT